MSTRHAVALRDSLIQLSSQATGLPSLQLIAEESHSIVAVAAAKGRRAIPRAGRSTIGTRSAARKLSASFPRRLGVCAVPVDEGGVGLCGGDPPGENVGERARERVDELHLASAVVSPCYYPLSMCARDSKALDVTRSSVRVAKATDFVALRVNCVESRSDCL